MSRNVGKLVSVNVGLLREIAWRGRTVFTGIWKEPVAGPRRVRRLNVDGDGQGDLNGHGGEQRAWFEVTQPRVTCYRVGIRMNEPRVAALLEAPADGNVLICCSRPTTDLVIEG